MRIEELIVSEEMFNNMKAISLVEAPAIEEELCYFGKEKYIILSKIADTEKRMVASPALIPNMLIPRRDDQGMIYQVYFNKDTVYKCMENYIDNAYNKFTVDHENNIDSLKLRENWIVENSKTDKANNYGFKNLNEGTWMVTMKIDNDYVWERIKNGTIKGLSIESYFTNRFSKFSKVKDETVIEENIKKILNSNLTEKEKEELIKKEIL